MVGLLQAKWCEQRYLKDKHRGGWDGGRHVEDKAARVKEGLVAAESESDLLWEGRANGVVRGWGKGKYKSKRNYASMQQGKRAIN